MQVERSPVNLLDAARVELAPGVRGPSRVPPTQFTPGPDDGFAYVVTLTVVHNGDRYVVERMECAQTDSGPPVDSSGLRIIPVAQLVSQAVVPYVWRGEPGERGSKWAPFVGASRDDAANGPTDEALRKVAVVYAVTYAVGQAPVKKVTEVFGVPRSTAGRWVTMARERGFLGPTTPGRAGEHG
ncbi:MAG TPA: hypothetical protein VK923_04055 [Euzebyales bacterium]|nr:hypothetical protein [Euzebyales bacterium]